MSKYISSIKQEYNKLLESEKKGENYLDHVATEEQIKKWTPKFIKITQELSALIYKFKDAAGREMTEDEILNGFKDVS